MLVLGGHASQAERCERPNGTASFQLTLITRSQGPSSSSDLRWPHKRPKSPTGDPYATLPAPGLPC